MQDMCVADKCWRKLVAVIDRITSEFAEDRWARLIEKYIRRHMADLMTFLVLDYGQMEVRVLAQVSGDKNLLADCESGDIHTTVGVVMTGWAAEQIKNDNVTRTRTKNCVFGIAARVDRSGLRAH
jgi:DNA polymerase I-like protein with 3'-5' exonuclease and polymerase domains